MTVLTYNLHQKNNVECVEHQKYYNFYFKHRKIQISGWTPKIFNIVSVNLNINLTISLIFTKN